jgi:hypothetical protein
MFITSWVVCIRYVDDMILLYPSVTAMPSVYVAGIVCVTYYTVGTGR